uniref:Uncharacterized protein n=1 Tax=Setaria viridis TaxID=4556 RepID=A0A4V6D4H4_SETVI|nr:hypothetical protein SEVIR_7G223750v2 [Setaria viridis]
MTFEKNPALPTQLSPSPADPVPQPVFFLSLAKARRSSGGRGLAGLSAPAGPRRPGRDASSSGQIHAGLAAEEARAGGARAAPPSACSRAERRRPERGAAGGEGGISCNGRRGREEWGEAEGVRGTPRSFCLLPGGEEAAGGERRRRPDLGRRRAPVGEWRGVAEQKETKGYDLPMAAWIISLDFADVEAGSLVLCIIHCTKAGAFGQSCCEFPPLVSVQLFYSKSTLRKLNQREFVGLQ